MHFSHNKKLKKIFNSFKLSTFVRIGEVREEIMDMVGEVEPGLLVLGSRGLGMVKRMFLGSISAHCIHHSDIPVLVVPLH